MSERYDVVVLGAGPAGEVAVSALAEAGKRVALVEPELIGGECTNWGCIPSKTLLRPADLVGQTARTAGVGTARPDFAKLAPYRNWMVSDYDDSKRIAGYEERGVTVLKAAGRLAGPGRVEVDGRRLEAGAVIVAVGGEPMIPDIPGLAEAGYWTNREATALRSIPDSTVFVGGGPTAVELGQFLARFGSRVTIVQRAPTLAQRESAEVGRLLGEILADDGVDLRLGSSAVSVAVADGERVVRLSDGSEVRGAELVVATGRRPRIRDLGLETVGIDATGRGIAVDERCRAADGIWAVGDATGIALFTHVGKYQARIVVADILGRPAKADYRAVPRVLFTDPEVAAVGLDEAAARERGLDVATATVDIPQQVARAYTYEREPRGVLGVVADRERRVLVGAWAVAPLAGEWIHHAVLAIRAEIPLEVLADTIAQFPTFSESFGYAIRALDLE